MKKLTGSAICIILSGLIAGVEVAAAQEPMGPPPVLVIQREVLKPGRAGSTHLKTESAFVQAMTAAKWPTHYLGAESLSGVPRALFFIGYPSFAAWEKDNQDAAKNATLSAAFDRASFLDGEQLSDYSTGVFVFNEGSSLRSNIDIAHMRYFEISQFRVRPGHEKEWSDLVKMYKSAFEKSVSNAQWAMYDSQYGAENGGLHLVFVPMKSLAEVDQSFADSKKFEATLGESGMKKLGELTATCIESSQTNVFQFNPKMSYPSDEWIKSDSFWKPKAAAVAKKPATP